MAKRKKKKFSKNRKPISIIILLAIVLVTSVYLTSKLTKNDSRNVNITGTNSTVSNNTPGTSTPGTIEPEIKEPVKPNTKPEAGTADKTSETKPSAPEISNNNTIANPIKANEMMVDMVIENYLTIYVNLSNDKELDYYYLDNVVYKSSSFHKVITQEIEKLRQQKAKLSLDDFSVNKVSKGTSESELLVEVSQTINDKETKYTYTIYFDKSGIFIKERK